MSSTKQVNTDGATGYQAESITVVNTPRNKSVIADVVNALSAFSPPNSDSLETAVLPAGVRAKLEYNNVKRCQYIIEGYKNSISDLANIYETLEQERPGRKQKLLHIIRICYETQLGVFVQKNTFTIDLVREHSDTILENIINDLRKRVIESSNLEADNEDVDIAIRIIVADAFIECRILENPEAIK